MVRIRLHLRAVILSTLPRKNMNLLYSIVCIEQIFDSRPFMYNKTILKNSFVGSSHLNASFGTFCVQIGQLFETHSEILKFRKNSKSTSFSFENSNFTVFKHFSHAYIHHGPQGYQFCLRNELSAIFCSFVILIASCIWLLRR